MSKIENKDFETELKRKFISLYNKDKHTQVIILCVGTDKIIGDSVGPNVGSKLEENLKINKEKVNIYGKIGDTLNFRNAQATIEKINKHKNPFIITIDSALSEVGRIGDVVINEGKIKIGSSLGRNLEWNSNINIKGIVGKHRKSPITNMETLKSRKQETIENMSNIIYEGVNKIIEEIK